MNLLTLASPLVRSINPNKTAAFYASAGYSTSSSGQQIPRYDPPVNVSAQVQDLSQKDIQHLDALNIQGSQRVIYLYGMASGVVRPKRQGGDLLYFDDVQEVWLVTAVLEQWPDWCKIAVTLQLESVPPFFPSLAFNDARNSQYVPLVLRTF